MPVDVQNRSGDKVEIPREVLGAHQHERIEEKFQEKWKNYI